MSSEQLRALLVSLGVLEDNILQLERAGLIDLAQLLRLLQEANSDHVRRFIQIASEIERRLDARAIRES